MTFSPEPQVKRNNESNSFAGLEPFLFLDEIGIEGCKNIEKIPKVTNFNFYVKSNANICELKNSPSHERLAHKKVCSRDSIAPVPVYEKSKWQGEWEYLVSLRTHSLLSVSTFHHS